MRKLLLTIVLVFATAAAHAETVRGDKTMAAAAWPMIEDGALVIDVRSTEEFESGHLDGAVHVPFEDTDALMSAIGENKDRPVVLYCGSGRRAETARQALGEAGYGQVHNASGLEALLATQPE